MSTLKTLKKRATQLKACNTGWPNLLCLCTFVFLQYTQVNWLCFCSSSLKTWLWEISFGWLEYVSTIVQLASLSLCQASLSWLAECLELRLRMFCIFDVPVDSVDFHGEPCGDVRSKSERSSPLLIVPMLTASLSGCPLTALAWPTWACAWKQIIVMVYTCTVEPFN